MPGNSSQPWGLIVPCRPATPSEGAAQMYHRVGPPGTQKTRTFENGTCLTFGPMDPVDEFNLYAHPFSNQVVLVDTVIRDCRAARSRYEGSGMAFLRQGNDEGDDEGSDDYQMLAKNDPFNRFRQTRLPGQQSLPPDGLQVVYLESGNYFQVPSIYGSCANLISLYSTPNKGDLRGLAHTGPGNDSRFGIVVKSAEGFQHKPRHQNGITHRSNEQNEQVEEEVTGKDSTEGAGNRSGNGGPRYYNRQQTLRAREHRRKTEQAEQMFSKVLRIHQAKKNMKTDHAFSKIPAEQAENVLQHRARLNAHMNAGQLHADQLYAEQANRTDTNTLKETYNIAPQSFHKARLSEDTGVEKRFFLGPLSSMSGQPRASLGRDQKVNYGFGANAIPPPLGFPPPIMGRMPVRYELEGSIPQNCLFKEHADIQAPLHGVKRTHEHTKIGPNQQYAKWLDEQNSLSRERGERPLRGDLFSGDAMMQQQFGIPVHVEAPTPKQMWQKTPTDSRIMMTRMSEKKPTKEVAIKVKAVEQTPVKEKTYKEFFDAQVAIKHAELAKLRYFVATEVSSAKGAAISNGPVHAESEPVSPRLKVPPTFKRAHSQDDAERRTERRTEGSLRSTGQILPEIVSVSANLPRVSLYDRLKGMPEADQPLSMPVPTAASQRAPGRWSGFGLGETMSLSTPVSPTRKANRSSLSRMVDQLPRLPVTRPSSRIGQSEVHSTTSAQGFPGMVANVSKTDDQAKKENKYERKNSLYPPPKRY
ncbi:hypothetical protein EG329_006929 [Mollisiaceae sp. DMI_Dod_QoI]|nr:hypothetical protein EG329_006929 [Helotiales sp. DMI_Dod_QoI]